MDLFSQAEHDEIAQAILLTPDAALLERVAARMRAPARRRCRAARSSRRRSPGAAR